jgi:RNA polymerase sigma factor (sigma-70 family)
MSMDPNSMMGALRRMAVCPALASEPDPVLLRRYLVEHDEAAFDVLVRRYGPLVWDVCRAVVPNDAEDAFQATFLVLARTGGSIREGTSLACWLHGVAYRTSMKARTSFARGRRREARVAVRESCEPDDLSWREVRAILHEELSRLPDKLRAVLVVCYLEGKTQDEAASLLGLPRGTLRGRLERARHLLRSRLARHGLGSAEALLAAGWPMAAASESVPPALALATSNVVKAVSNGAPAAMASQAVVSLTRGVTRAMFMDKLKCASAAVAVTLALAGSGYGLAALAGRHPTEEPDSATRGFDPVVPPAADVSASGDEPPKNAKSPEAAAKAADDLKKLEGTWDIVDAERGGKRVAADERKGMTVSIRDGKLVIDSPAGASQPFLIRVDPSPSPKHIDMIPAVGEAILGIYELDGDSLKLGWGNVSKAGERQKEFKTSPAAPGSSVLHLRRQKNAPIQKAELKGEKNPVQGQPETPRDKAIRLKLVEVSMAEDNLATPCVYFFKGQKNEVRVAPGESALVELPGPARELTWQIPGYQQEGVGDREGSEFDYVLFAWDAKTGKATWTMYRKPDPAPPTRPNAAATPPGLAKTPGAEPGGVSPLREVTEDPVLLADPQGLKSSDRAGRALKVTSKRLEHGLIEFSIRIDPDAVEKNDLYKGRITATAHLSVSNATKQVAWIQVAAEKEWKETGFRLSIDPDLAKFSTVLVGTHLHEKDGTPTLGGGHMFLIPLKGFVP